MADTVVADTTIGPASNKRGPAADLRVLFVVNAWPAADRPWYGSFIKRQADSLRALGIDIEVLAINGYVGRSAYLRAARQAVSLNRTRRFDIVHAQYGHAGLVARMQVRAPLVLSYLGSDLLGARTWSNGLTARSRVEVAVFRQLARCTAATITMSREMERVLPPACRRRNHVIPHGVDLKRFEPIDRLTARRILGWPADEVSVLFVGHPGRADKNYPLAKAVCDRLRGEIGQLHLRVAADVAPDMMPVWMSAADALVHPSRSEGSPNAVKEAMASMLPIVATPVGDVPELLAGLSGCFVVAADCEAMVCALARSVRHGPVPEARVAATRVATNAMAKRVVEVYEDVLR
jgi:teichuronic acid biosynthesis glycosyltransferase TuaC